MQCAVGNRAQMCRDDNFVRAMHTGKEREDTEQTSEENKVIDAGDRPPIWTGDVCVCARSPWTGKDSSVKVNDSLVSWVLRRWTSTHAHTHTFIYAGDCGLNAMGIQGFCVRLWPTQIICFSFDLFIYCSLRCGRSFRRLLPKKFWSEFFMVNQKYTK